MISTILSLFKWTPVFQILLSGSAFFALMLLITIRLLYGYGLTASFSSSTPHLTIELIEGETKDIARLSSMLKTFEKTKEISAFSLFAIGTKTLKIRSQKVFLVGSYKFEAPVEITGIDLRHYPFAIPLDQAESLSNEDYHTSYTMKELAGKLLFNKNTVIINQATANLFSPRPGKAAMFNIWDSESDKKIGKIKIIGVINDLLDKPRIITNIKMAQQILKKQAFRGIYARVHNIQEIEKAQKKLKNDLGPLVQVSSWKDGQNRQQKLFKVFDSIFWIIATAVVILSVITGVLGIYRVFMIKRRSLSILLTIGVSKTAFLVILGGINFCALTIGLIMALGAFLMMSGWLNDQLISSLQAVLPIDAPSMRWSQFFLWNGGVFILYTLMSLVFLNIILSSKTQLK